MKRPLFAALGGAFVFFFWGWVYWGMIQVPGGPKPIAQEAAVLSVLKDSLPGSGSYFAPFHDDSKMNIASPRLHLFYEAEATVPMSGARMLMGFIHLFISCFLMVCLLKIALPEAQSYGQRLGFILLTAVLLAFYSEFSQPIWWHHPLDYHLANAGYILLGWLFAGMTMLKIYPPRRRLGD